MESKEYLKSVFHMMKRVGDVNLGSFRSRFNHSEMRMIEEITLARGRGERVISTQLARALGITRSAVSQMINRLEMHGILKRSPDKIDRKIAYIELTEEAEEIYRKEREAYCATLSRVIEKMGEEKFSQCLALAEEFCDIVDKEVGY